MQYSVQFATDSFTAATRGQTHRNTPDCTHDTGDPATRAHVSAVRLNPRHFEHSPKRPAHPAARAHTTAAGSTVARPLGDLLRLIGKCASLCLTCVNLAEKSKGRNRLHSYIMTLEGEACVLFTVQLVVMRTNLSLIRAYWF